MADIDPLGLFLESCDPEKVSREWHVVKNRRALLMERPRAVTPRRVGTSVLRVERMLAELRGQHDPES